MEITVTIRRTSLDRYSVVTHLRNEDGMRIARSYNVVRDESCAELDATELAWSVHFRATTSLKNAIRQGVLF